MFWHNNLWKEEAKAMTSEELSEWEWLGLAWGVFCALGTWLWIALWRAIETSMLSRKWWLINQLLPQTLFFLFIQWRKSLKESHLKSINRHSSKDTWKLWRQTTSSGLLFKQWTSCLCPFSIGWDLWMFQHYFGTLIYLGWLLNHLQKHNLILTWILRNK